MQIAPNSAPRFSAHTATAELTDIFPRAKSHQIIACCKRPKA